VQEGQPREIYEQPSNDFVAGFVGQANLFSGTVARAAANLLDVDTRDGLIIRIALPPSSKPVKSGEPIFLSIRPEAIELRERGTDLHEVNRIEGQIAASAYQGSLVEYEILALGRTLKARVTNPKGKPLFQRGEQVTLLFAPEDVVLVPGS